MSIWRRIERRVTALAGEILADDARLALEQARELLEDDPAQAALIAERVSEERPDLAVGWALLGSARLLSDDAEGACNSFERALSIDATLPEALLGAGLSHLRCGHIREAIPRYQLAVREAGGDRDILAEAYRGLGFCYWRQGERDKSIREFRKAVAEEPENPWGRAGLAASLWRGQHRKVEETRRHLRRATESDVVPALAHLIQGRIALADGDPEHLDMAIESFERARDVAASESQMYSDGHDGVAAAVGLAEAQLELGEATLAKDALDIAKPRESSDPHVLLLAARIAHSLENPADAVMLYRRAVDVRSDVDILERAIDAALSGSDFDSAAEFADRLLTIDPTSSRARVARGECALANGDEDVAAGAFADVLERTGDGAAAVRLGELKAKGGSFAESARLARRALAADSGDVPARTLLTDALEHIFATTPLSGTGPEALLELSGRIAVVCAERPELAALATDAQEASFDFDRPLMVTVMGEFSTGKSSFVNAFVGYDVAPVGITPTTATINVMRYGRERSGRIMYRDGRVERLEWDTLSADLARVTKRNAAEISHVEVLLPLPSLEQVHLVDTPGLNSILPEHEEVARGFIRRSDAVVWLFRAGQAGTKSERENLEQIRNEGKRVLGVLNKIDQLTADEIDAVDAHIRAEVGDLLADLVPVSAVRARAPIGDDDGNWAALVANLEHNYFDKARDLKREALHRRLGGILHEAHRTTDEMLARSEHDATSLGRASERIRRASVEFIEDTVDRVRSSMTRHIGDLYRRAAREVLELVRPRRTPFGSHTASRADRDYLISLLEAGYETAIESGQSAVAEALQQAGAEAIAALAPLSGESRTGPQNEITRSLNDALELIAAQVFDRAHAYVSGFLRGGFIDKFFERDVPKLSLEEDPVYRALFRDSPDLDRLLAVPLASVSVDALIRLADRLDNAIDVAEIAKLELEMGAKRALRWTSDQHRELKGP